MASAAKRYNATDLGSISSKTVKYGGQELKTRSTTAATVALTKSMGIEEKARTTANETVTASQQSLLNKKSTSILHLKLESVQHPQNQRHVLQTVKNFIRRQTETQPKGGSASARYLALTES